MPNGEGSTDATRKLDALVAREVMEITDTTPRPYSTESDAMGYLLVRMRELGWSRTIDPTDQEGVRVTWHRGDLQVSREARALPHAVALAALDAVRSMRSPG